MWIKTIRKSRKQRGAILAETTASTALICGFVLAIIYVVAEASFSLIIMNGLNQAAREGAREMSILYLKSGGNQTPDSSAIEGVFQDITVGGVVNSSSQFTASWPSSYPRNSHPPLMVTVTCTAAPGQAGQNGNGPNLVFPWGVISLWTSKFAIDGMVMKASATYPLRP